MSKAPGRLLHFVYKIADRTESVKFYRSLGMKILRHEEFEEGCDAQVRGKKFMLEIKFNYSAMDLMMENGVKVWSVMGRRMIIS